MSVNIKMSESSSINKEALYDSIRAAHQRISPNIVRTKEIYKGESKVNL